MMIRRVMALGYPLTLVTKTIVALWLAVMMVGYRDRTYLIPPDSMRWSGDNETTFLVGCEKSAGAAYCGCALNYLESNTSFDQLVADTMASGATAASIRAAAQYCLGR